MPASADASPYDWLVWSDGELEAALASGARRRDVLAYLGEEDYTTLAPLARAAARATRDPDRVVHLIPGIMGSQLGYRRATGEPPDLLWVDPIDVQRGRLEELNADNRELVSLGAAPYSYLGLKLRLESAGFTVRWADYDWRRGIDAVGADLAARLAADPDRQHLLVGHSLGGLVARAALQPQGTSADRMLDRIGMIVTLGTPHGGSYAALQALRAAYVSVRRVAQLDPRRSAEVLTETIFGRFPSLYQMLPATEEGLDLRDPSQWPTSTPRPCEALLAQIGRLQLPSHEGRLQCIVGTGFDTVVRVTREANQFCYHVTQDGDGTVARTSAAAGSAQRWYVQALHGELPRDARVASAVVDLLTGGTTASLGRDPPPPAIVSRTVTDARLQEACQRKLEWGTMTPAQRHAWFEALNAPVAAGSDIEDPA
jgi:pimeloyl-ACP methyl ester carboxylesterase